MLVSTPWPWHLPSNFVPRAWEVPPPPVLPRRQNSGRPEMRTGKNRNEAQEQEYGIRCRMRSAKRFKLYNTGTGIELDRSIIVHAREVYYSARFLWFSVPCQQPMHGFQMTCGVNMVYHVQSIHILFICPPPQRRPGTRNKHYTLDCGDIFWTLFDTYILGHPLLSPFWSMSDLRIVTVYLNRIYLCGSR